MYHHSSSLFKTAQESSFRIKTQEIIFRIENLKHGRQLEVDERKFFCATIFANSIGSCSDNNWDAYPLSTFCDFDHNSFIFFFLKSFFSINLVSIIRIYLFSVLVIVLEPEMFTIVISIIQYSICTHDICISMYMYSWYKSHECYSS